MNPKLQQCYDAFERLKAGKGEHTDCKGLPLSQITFSKISLEAGHDAGYLKKSREQHKLLLSMLMAFINDLPSSTTMGKGAALKRQKTMVKNAKEDALQMKEKLDASLGRELQLYHRLKEAEEEICQLKERLSQNNNIVNIAI